MRAHHRIIIVVAVIAGVVGFQLYTFLNLEPTPVKLVSVDLVSYFASLLQKNNSELLSRDTIYGNGQFANSIWCGSAYLFMATLNAFYHLTQGDVWMAYGLLVLFTLTVYLVIAYVFFASILPDWRLALALAVVSSVVSHFSATSTYWGVPPNIPKNTVQLIPQVWYNVFSVFVAWLIVRAVSVAGDKSIHISHWKAAGQGVLIGVSIFAVHSVSATALIEIMGFSGLALVLRRKLSLWSVVIFGAAALPFLVYRLLNGSGSATRDVSLDASRLVILLGRNWTVFPWETRFRRPTVFRDALSFNNLVTTIVLGAALYALLTIVFAILAMRDRPRQKLWKTLFIVTQAGLCLVTFRAGWLPVLALIYGCVRVWRGTEDELDRGLLTVMMIALIAGPIQQMVMYYVWALTGLVKLTPIIFEMARFEGLAYLPLYVLVGRAIWELSGAVRRQWLRLATAGALCLLVYLNLATTPLPLGFRSPWQALLGLLALALILYRLNAGSVAAIARFATGQKILAALALAAGLGGAGLVLFGIDDVIPPPVMWAGLALAVLGWAGLAVMFIPRLGKRRPSVALVLGIALLLVGYVFVARDTPLPEADLTLPFEETLVLPDSDSLPGSPDTFENDADYLDAAAWARTNTPVDSLFHITDLNSNFRYFSQRSILHANGPLTIAIYGGSDPAVLFSLLQELRSLQKGHAEEFTAFLAHYHVDYVLAWRSGVYRTKLAEVSDCGRTFTPTVVFENETYVIYWLRPGPEPARPAAPASTQDGQFLCPLASPGISPSVPEPCGAAAVPASGNHKFLLRDYPACAPTGEDLTVKCLTGDGQWTADAVSDVDNTSAPGEVSFTARQVGTCGLFSTK